MYFNLVSINLCHHMSIVRNFPIKAEKLVSVFQYFAFGDSDINFDFLFFHLAFLYTR